MHRQYWMLNTCSEALRQKRWGLRLIAVNDIATMLSSGQEWQWLWNSPVTCHVLCAVNNSQMEKTKDSEKSAIVYYNHEFSGRELVHIQSKLFFQRLYLRSHPDMMVFCIRCLISKFSQCQCVQLCLGRTSRSSRSYSDARWAVIRWFELPAYEQNLICAIFLEREMVAIFVAFVHASFFACAWCKYT